jgi:uncharacterized protein
VTGAAPYQLGPLTAGPGTQVRGLCPVDLGPATVELPVVITHGAMPGPVLGVTAGIHGGEYVPMVAVRQFVAELDPEQMSGTVVACLQSSPVAFERRMAFVNPLDGKNLNRSFPGDPDGSPTERLAAWLWANLLSRSDYYVDCHCGDLPESLESFAGVSPGPDGVMSEQALAMADMFDVARLLVERTEGSTVRTAALNGAHALLVEIGGEGRWSQGEADVQGHGLRRVLTVAGIMPGGGTGRHRLPVFEDAGDVIAKRGGLWFPAASVGSTVDEGAVLGHLESVLGDDVQEILSPAAGVITYGLSSLAAVPGDLLVSLSRPVTSGSERG